MTDSTRKSLGTRIVVGALVYALVLGGIVSGMFALRHSTLVSMNTPEAQAEWDAWRAAEPNQRTDLPVKRRAPSSAEPPALVLMRDHFGVMLAGAILFGSLLFAALAFALSGALARTKADLPAVGLRKP